MKNKIILFPLFLLLVAAQSPEMRDFEENASQEIKETYYHNHTKQTLAFVLAKERQYCRKTRSLMSMWDVALKMQNFIDASDPDLHLPQIYHALQVGQAMRKDNLPREWIVAGFIHDFGKVLFLFGEPQWAVVGDTFPVGCAFSKNIVFHSYFEDNPDFFDPRLNTYYGIYKPHCGLDNVHLSWGHDEYLYHVIRNTKLPEEIKYAIRYHSFYPHHEHNAYAHLLNEKDHAMLKWIKLLNSYDLYTKTDETLDIEALMPYYKELVEEFFPDPLEW